MGRSAMYFACEKGLVSVVSTLVAHGVSLDSAVTTEACGYFPLHVAVKCNHTELVRKCLALGAGVNSKCRSGVSPLSIACSLLGVDPYIVSLLLGAGADGSLTVNGRHPLCLAIIAGNASAVRFLLDSLPKIDVNDSICEPSWTALHVAAAHNHGNLFIVIHSNFIVKNFSPIANIVWELLYSYSADPRKVDSSAQAKTPLMVAEELGAISAKAVIVDFLRSL
jgi:ankyrin repeat protein